MNTHNEASKAPPQRNANPSPSAAATPPQGRTDDSSVLGSNRFGSSSLETSDIGEDGDCAAVGPPVPRKPRFRYIPEDPVTKVPLIKDWPSKFTDDPHQIEAWQKQFPGCGWAVQTGADVGFVVLDVDNKPGGFPGSRSLQEVVMAHLARGQALPSTWTVNTANGGIHYYFRHPGPFLKSFSSFPLSGTTVGGIELKGDTGAAKVRVPPTPGYVWSAGRNDMPDGPAEMPPWMLKAFMERMAADEAKAAKSIRREPNSEWAKVIGEYNEENNTADEWPEKEPGTCPICQHHGCFKKLQGSDTRWICYSANHDEGGVQSYEGYWTGDALDIAVAEAGASVAEVLKEAGYELPKENQSATVPPAPGETTSTQKRFDWELVPANEFIQRQQPETTWLSRPFVPANAVIALGGEPGARKTWFLFAQIKLITEQGKRVIYVTNEASERDIQNRLKQTYGEKAVPGSLHILHGSSFNLLEDSTVHVLLGKVEAIGGADLLILDPLSNLISGLDENEAKEMSLVRDRILLSQRRMACSVLLVMHTRKETWGKDEDPNLGWFRGSGVWGGSLDIGLIIQKNEEDAEEGEESSWVTNVKAKSWGDIPQRHCFKMVTGSQQGELRTHYSLDDVSNHDGRLAAIAKLQSKALAAIEAEAGVTTKRLMEAMGPGDDHAKREAIADLVGRGVVMLRDGKNNSKHHLLVHQVLAWRATAQ